MSKLIYIHSKDRLRGSNSSTDFQVECRLPMRVRSVVVKSVSFPNLMYNVRGTSRTFTYSVLGVQANVTVAEGQYSFTQLTDALKTLLDAQLATAVTFTLNNITNKASLNFGAGITASVLNRTDGNGMADILGILVSSGADAQTHIFTGIPQLYGVTNALIMSNTLCQGFNAVNSRNDLIGVLTDFPISVAYGEIQHYENNDSVVNHKQFVTTHVIDVIDIRITDDDGVVLDIGGNDCIIVLKAFPYED